MKRIPFQLALLPFLFLFSCQNSADRKEAAPLNDSTSYSGLTGDSVKLVKTAAIDFKVKDVEQSTRAVSGLAKQYGGMIYNQNLITTEEGRKELKLSADSLMVIRAVLPHASIMLRVPSTNLEEFMYSVAGLGYYTGSSQLSIDDKSLIYLQNALKQKVRTDVLLHPVSKKNATSTLTTIGIKDETIDQQIANKTIDADAAYSTINLTLFQNTVVRKEVIANYVLSDYELPFGKRFMDAVHNGWQYFLEFFLALMHLWVLLILCFLCFLYYRYSLQKRKMTVLNIKS